MSLLLCGLSPAGFREPSSHPAFSTTNDALRDFDSIRTNVRDYIWPTDASTRITSSFGEYRTMHFHGGLDISTNGTVGHNVFAVRDGYLYKISITPNGYGKMLFIKHEDGYYSVYVHLQKFSDKIEQVARQEQVSKGSYGIEKTFDTPIVQVKKGEVIAYTGDTGVGPPHLHFEIRDEHLNNINPMLMYGETLEDNIAPTVTGVALFPIDINSAIDGKESPKYMGRLARGKRISKIPQTIRVHGKVGFGIRGYDKANGVGNKSGIYRMELFLDDKLTFVKQLDRFPAMQTKQIYLDYDYTTILQGKGEFQKLYEEEGATLPFYDNVGGIHGVINTQIMTEGEHSYKIVCKDFHNNPTAIEGKLFVNHTPSIDLVTIDNQSIQLKSKESDVLSKFTVFGKSLTQKNWVQTILKKEQIQKNNASIQLAFNSKKFDIIKLVAETKLGIPTEPVVRFLKKPQGPASPIKLKFEQSHNFIRVTALTTGAFTSTPLIILKEGTSVRDIPVAFESLTEYSGAFQPSEVSTGVCRVDVSAEVNGIQTSVTETLELYGISSTSSGSFAFGNDGLIVSYEPGAVYKPLLLQVKNESTPTATKFNLAPTNVILNGGFRVSVPITLPDIGEKHGLFFRGNGGWVFQTATPDADKKYFSTTLTRTLGELAIFKDEAPPSIGKVRVIQSKGFVGGSFRYSDNLSGVDFNELKVTIDDQIVIPEIDDEHHYTSFRTIEPLKAGKHTLVITMRDRMKNESKVSRVITVKSTGTVNP